MPVTIGGGALSAAHADRHRLAESALAAAAPSSTTVGLRCSVMALIVGAGAIYEAIARPDRSAAPHRVDG